MARIRMEDRMAHPRLVKSAVGAVALLVLTVGTIAAQNGSVPNPDREDTNWAKLPAGAKSGGAISFDPAANGGTWGFHRSDPPLLRCDPAGNCVKSVGHAMVVP